MSNLINGIGYEVEYGAEKNPHFKDSDGWTCTLYYDDRYLEVPFYMGKGHHGEEPKMIDVLDCLFSDSNAYEMDFDEWCSEYGYDNDSIRALRTFEQCKETGRKLRELFVEDYESIQEEVWELIS